MKKRFIVMLTAAVVLGGIQGRQSARSLRDERAVRIVKTHSSPVALTRTLPATPEMTTWEALELGDYPHFIELLRASGCPEATVRDLVMMRVTREFHAKQMAMEAQRQQNVEWWHNFNDDATRIQSRQEVRHLRREMKDKICTLLGISYEELLSGFTAYKFPGSQETWLSPDKNDAYTAMLDRFQDEKDELKLATKAWASVLDDDQKARLVALEKQQRADLASLLSPAELEAYDLRHSEAARYVLDQLPQALSEKEFRTMVKVAQESGTTLRMDWYEWGVQTSGPSDAEAKKQEVLSKIQAALGTEVVEAQQKAAKEQAAQEAAAEKVRQRQEEVAPFLNTAEAVGLDKSAGQKFFDRFELYIKQLDGTLPSGKGLDEHQQAQIQAQIEAEVEAIAVETMGEKGHEFMKKLKEHSRKH
jgi:hypothetical protein